MITIGILSDTHISEPSPEFLRKTRDCFSECDIIVHAGDLTDIGILSVFANKKVYAVAGNCCNMRTQKTLNQAEVFEIEGLIFALCHGANGPRHNIEDRLFDTYPEADCIIYGHTHITACHTTGSVLYINPGSFQSTGRYGAAGTYAIAKIEGGKVVAKIMEVS